MSCNYCPVIETLQTIFCFLSELLRNVSLMSHTRCTLGSEADPEEDAVSRSHVLSSLVK